MGYHSSIELVYDASAPSAPHLVEQDGLGHHGGHGGGAAPPGDVAFRRCPSFGANGSNVVGGQGGAAGAHAQLVGGVELNRVSTGASGGGLSLGDASDRYAYSVSLMDEDDADDEEQQDGDDDNDEMREDEMREEEEEPGVEVTPRLTRQGSPSSVAQWGDVGGADVVVPGGGGNYSHWVYDPNGGSLEGSGSGSASSSPPPLRKHQGQRRTSHLIPDDDNDVVDIAGDGVGAAAAAAAEDSPLRPKSIMGKLLERPKSIMRTRSSGLLRKQQQGQPQQRRPPSPPPGPHLLGGHIYDDDDFDDGRSIKHEEEDRDGDGGGAALFGCLGMVDTACAPLCRNVRWRDPHVVSETRTRPRWNPEEKTALFYTRREYRKFKILARYQRNAMEEEESDDDYSASAAGCGGFGGKSAQRTRQHDSLTKMEYENTPDGGNSPRAAAEFDQDDEEDDLDLVTCGLADAVWNCLPSSVVSSAPTTTPATASTMAEL